MSLWIAGLKKGTYILDATSPRPIMLIVVQQEFSTIYVELLDEGTNCWRPVSAERLSLGVYRIVGTKPEDETWRFQPGDVVRCKDRNFGEGSGLVAYEEVASSV